MEDEPIHCPQAFLLSDTGRCSGQDPRELATSPSEAVASRIPGLLSPESNYRSAHI